jgi:pyruvate/2-oxoglutarate dehydrogenase complex dihydrolipoamide dehydrogenase (E3) component
MHKRYAGPENYDAVIVAIGARPIVPKLPGIDKPHVHWAPHAEAHEVPCGERVVIVGAGAVGIEAAIDLKREGKEVTVIEMMDGYQSLMASASGGFDDLMALIKELDIPVLLGTKLDAVEDDFVLCTDIKSGACKKLAADTVLLAIGVTPKHEEADMLRRSCPETSAFIIGDCHHVGDNIANATMSALKAAAYI